MKKKTKKVVRKSSPAASERDALFDARAAAARRRDRDVALAHQRIGTTTEARCRWLLDEFVIRDPAALSSGELATLRDQLLALAGFGGAFEGPLPGPANMSGTLDMDRDPVLVDDGALRQVWERVGALTRAHQAPVVLPPGEEILTVNYRGGPYVRLTREWVTNSLADLVILRAVSLLEDCDRLRICPECDRIFVARRRQERHPRCARKARDARRPSRQPKKAR
jgi:hypothetical protein